MDFLGIGPLEIIFILIIALVIFGPNDIVRAGKSLGSFMRKVVTSDAWRAFQQASKGMRDIPTTLMREAGLEENDLRELSGIEDLERTTKEIEQSTKELKNQISPWTTPPNNTPFVANNPGADEILEKPNSPQIENPTPGIEKSTTPEEPPTPPPGSPFSQAIDDNN